MKLRNPFDFSYIKTREKISFFFSKHAESSFGPERVLGTLTRNRPQDTQAMVFKIAQTEYHRTAVLPSRVMPKRSFLSSPRN